MKTDVFYSIIRSKETDYYKESLKKEEKEVKNLSPKEKSILQFNSIIRQAKELN